MRMRPSSRTSKAIRQRAVCLLAAGVLVGLGGCADRGVDRPSGAEKRSPSAPAVLSEENFADDVIAAQAEAGSAHIAATIGVSGQSFELSGDVAGLGTPDDIEMDVTAAVAGQELQMLIVHRVLYLKGEGFAPAGKEWLKADLSDPNNPLGQIFDSANPGNFNAYLQGVTTLKDQGTETVDGVRTRHYSLTIDTARMLTSNPMFKGQDASTLGLPDELTTQAYIDDDNRPVWLKVDLETTGSLDVHFSDYGKDVTVSAPDPSTVGELGR